MAEDLDNDHVLQSERIDGTVVHPVYNNGGWQKYPETKPGSIGEYLVVVQYNMDPSTCDRPIRCIDKRGFVNNSFQLSEDFDAYFWDITHWQELPPLPEDEG